MNGDKYLNVSKTIDKDVIPPDGTAKVTLKVTNIAYGERWYPVDVVFAIDSSGSMDDSDPHGLRRTVSVDFIDDKMDASKDRVGVVSWDHKVDFSVPLSSNFDDVKSKIQEIDSEGGTYIDKGLDEAIRLLEESKNPDPNAKRIIVFLTDGEGGYTSRPIKYPVYTIGLKVSDRGREILEQIGKEDSKGDYYPAEKAEELQRIYDDIAHDVIKKPVRGIALTDVLQSYFEVKTDSIGINPTEGPIRNPDGTTVMKWDIGTLESLEPWETSFDVICNLSNLPVDVAEILTPPKEISHVKYTYPEQGFITIPSGKVSIKCLPSPPQYPPYAILVLTSIFLDPSSPTEGEKATITAIIQNIGGKDAGAFDVGFYANKQLIGKKYHVDELKSGVTISLKTEWIAKEGADITVDITSTSNEVLTPPIEGTPANQPTPGFETIFAITALLAVAYLVRRRKKV